MGNRSLGAGHRGLDVQVHDLVVNLLGVLQQRGLLGHTCIVDQNINMAKSLRHAVEGLLHSLEAGQIQPQRLHNALGKFFLQLGQGLHGGFFPAGQEDNGSAFPQESLNGGKADSPASSGNDCNFIGQFHIKSSFMGWLFLMASS